MLMPYKLIGKGKMKKVLDGKKDFDIYWSRRGVHPDDARSKLAGKSSHNGHISDLFAAVKNVRSG